MRNLRTKGGLSFLAWLGMEQRKRKADNYSRALNEVYENYNNALKKSGFNLEKYKGKSATLYTYNITNHPSEDDIIADLIVSNGVLIGADLCNPSADHGFLKGLEKNDTAS